METNGDSGSRTGSPLKRPTANGERIRYLRDVEWLTQEELSELTGIDNQTISRIETGETLHPRKATLKRLASGLGVDWKDLITGGPDPPFESAPLENDTNTRGILNAALGNLESGSQGLAEAN